MAVGTSDLPMKVRSLGAKTKQTMPGRMDIHVGFRHVIAAACLSINARGSVAPCCNPVLRRSPDSAKEVDNDNYCCATTRTRARTHTHHYIRCRETSKRLWLPYALKGAEARAPHLPECHVLLCHTSEQIFGTWDSSLLPRAHNLSGSC